MQDRMQRFINKTYPFDFEPRKRLIISSWSGLSIFLFILFFQPFNIELPDINNYLLLIAGFSGISIFFQLLIHLSIPIGKLSFRPGRYNFNILLLFELLIWILTSVAFSFYLFYVGNVDLSIFLVFRIVLVCLLPLVSNMLIYEIHDLRIKVEEAGKKEKEFASEYPLKVKEHFVELVSGNRSERLKILLDKLLFARSAENYVEIHHLEGGKPKMKLLRTTLKSIEDQLEKYPLVIRCHRKCLVNIDKIEKLKRVPGGYAIILAGYDENISVSRQYLLRVKDAVENRL